MAMHREIAELFMYGDLDKNSILYRLGEIFEAIDSGSYNRQQVIREVKVQLKRLLVLATDYGFDKNLWHNYIAFFLLMNENPFSLVCEKSAVSEGTVTSIVKEDFAHIRRIFLYDFSAVEQALGVNCFSILHTIRRSKRAKKSITGMSAKRCRRCLKSSRQRRMTTRFIRLLPAFITTTASVCSA